jgi:hypothetical protein
MSKNKKIRKNDLFSLYAQNLSVYCPEYTDQFLCPICLNEFSRKDLDLLTCAHVFPNKLGGRLLTLSCTACDSRIGHEFNWHAVAEKKVRIWKKKPMYGRFIPENGPKANISTVWDFDRSIIYIYPPPGIPLEIWKRWIDDIRGKMPNGGPYKFSIEQKEPTFVPTRRDISHIHSAFLMMFYLFGYEYVLSPNVDNIRQMFNGNDLSWKPSKLVRPVKLAPESQGQLLDLPQVGIVIEPKDLCSFAILLPSLDTNDSANIVFLPGLSEDGWNFYKHLEINQTPNEKCTMVYPTQIQIHNPDPKGGPNLPCTVHYDIINPNSKGCANNLYQIFAKLEKSDISNMDVHIRSSIKSGANQ